MKSSTFSLLAIVLIPVAYFGMALLENKEEAETKFQRHVKAARNQCGNADWTMVEEGDKLTITCVRRKPLNGSKVKP